MDEVLSGKLAEIKRVRDHRLEACAKQSNADWKNAYMYESACNTSAILERAILVAGAADSVADIATILWRAAEKAKREADDAIDCLMPQQDHHDDDWRVGGPKRGEEEQHARAREEERRVNV